MEKAKQSTKRTKLAIVYEVVILTLALISVFFMFSDNETIIYLDKAVWAIFFLDVFIRFIVAKEKWQFIKKNPFDIIAAIPLGSIFQMARLARLFRLLRLIAITKNYFPKFLKLMKTNNLDRILAIAAIVMIVGGTIVTFAEPDIDTFIDGLWWAIVTTTTVGYGDISPVTLPGRIVASILMLIGIGIIGVLTSSITAFFIDENDSRENGTTQFIKDQVSDIHNLSPEEINHIIILLEAIKKETIEKQNNS